MAGKRTNTDTATSTLVDDQQPSVPPAEGGSYTRCAESGELTLVARTSHDAIAEDVATNVDSQESQV